MFLKTWIFVLIISIVLIYTKAVPLNTANTSSDTFNNIDKKISEAVSGIVTAPTPAAPPAPDNSNDDDDDDDDDDNDDDDDQRKRRAVNFEELDDEDDDGDDDDVEQLRERRDVDDDDEDIDFSENEHEREKKNAISNEEMNDFIDFANPDINKAAESSSINENDYAESKRSKRDISDEDDDDEDDDDSDDHLTRRKRDVDDDDEGDDDDDDDLVRTRRDVDDEEGDDDDDDDDEFEDVMRSRTRRDLANTTAPAINSTNSKSNDKCKPTRSVMDELLDVDEDENDEDDDESPRKRRDVDDDDDEDDDDDDDDDDIESGTLSRQRRDLEDADDEDDDDDDDDDDFDINSISRKRRDLGDNDDDDDDDDDDLDSVSRKRRDVGVEDDDDDDDDDDDAVASLERKRRDLGDAEADGDDDGDDDDDDVQRKKRDTEGEGDDDDENDDVNTEIINNEADRMKRAKNGQEEDIRQEMPKEQTPHPPYTLRPRDWFQHVTTPVSVTDLVIDEPLNYEIIELGTQPRVKIGQFDKQKDVEKNKIRNDASQTVPKYNDNGETQDGSNRTPYNLNTPTQNDEKYAIPMSYKLDPNDKVNMEPNNGQHTRSDSIASNPSGSQYTSNGQRYNRRDVNSDENPSVEISSVNPNTSYPSLKNKPGNFTGYKGYPAFNPERKTTADSGANVLDERDNVENDLIDAGGESPDQGRPENQIYKPLGGQPNGPVAMEEKLQNEFGSMFVPNPKVDVMWYEPKLLTNCWVQAMLSGQYRFSPNCNDDGTFAPKQCYLQRCWCVNRDGSVQDDDKTRFSYKVAGAMLKCVQNY